MKSDEIKKDLDKARKENGELFDNISKLRRSKEIEDLREQEKELKDKFDLILNPLREKLRISDKEVLKLSRLYHLAQTRERKSQEVKK